MASLKAPIYALPHGIEVVGEYAPNAKFPYWRVRVRPHPLIVGKIVHGGIYTRRSKAVATAALGRVITDNEHVHHENGREDDNPAHLEVLSAAMHNAHHKTGSTHRESVKTLISQSLKRAYAEGRRTKPKPREQRGEANPIAKLTWDAVHQIRASSASDAQLAVAFGVSRRNISMVRQGKTWK